MNRTDLLQAVNIVLPAVSTKDFQPVLKCIKNDTLTMNAYNGELYISTMFASTLNCVIPADSFFKLISSIKKEDIEIEQVDSTLTLKAGRSKSVLALCEDSFPEPPDTAQIVQEHITLNTDFFAKLKVGKIFMGKDETQPVYRGVYLKDGWIAQIIAYTRKVIIITTI